MNGGTLTRWPITGWTKPAPKPEMCPHLPDPRVHSDIWLFKCAECETYWYSKPTPTGDVLVKCSQRRAWKLIRRFGLERANYTTNTRTDRETEHQ